VNAARVRSWLRALALVVCAAVLAACGGGSSGSGTTPAPTASSGALSIGLAVVAPLLTAQPLPASRYGQLRVFVLRHDEALAASASDAKLQYNDQLERTDAGVTRQLPIEFADSGLGMRVDGPIVVGAGTTTSMTLQWDLERSLVRFAADDGVDRVTMRPALRAYDLAATGAIVGVIDKTLFCTDAPSGGCISDVVASAELPTADGRSTVSVRSTPVVVGDNFAEFALYPLPASPSGLFDVVIRGHGMRTMLIRDVPASAADLLAAAPTQLGANPADPSHPLPMVPVSSAAGDGSATLAQAVAPAGAQLRFGQTLAGEPTREIAVASTDPFSGRLAQPLALPSGPLRVATYSATEPLSFEDVTPIEGADGFGVTTLGTRYDGTGGPVVVAVPGGSSVAFAAPDAPARGDLDSAQLTVKVVAGSKPAFDAAELVIADVGGIVATHGVSALIDSGGQVSITLAAGPNAAALGAGAVYSVALRAWQRAAPDASLHWVRASAPVDLRNAASGEVTIALP
jgi:hypothetical protein